MLFQKVISVTVLATALLEGSFHTAMPDKNADGYLFLVNQQHIISSDYLPEVRKANVSGASQSMNAVAAAALEEMFKAAKSESNITLSAVSGYRSFSKQGTLYSRKKQNIGSAKADLLVALPGASEHQLGMAMDVSQKGSSRLNVNFGKTKGGLWISENAHRFGFIVRYQLGFESITGYSYEPWHVRYVGKEHAQAIYESKEPMEIHISKHRLRLYEYLIHFASDEVNP
ncbi:MAG: M15 family metallopeptidase [Clostridia bacterium]|nr:M15 family metallopeptidase [Clostridia bacterium]